MTKQEAIETAHVAESFGISYEVYLKFSLSQGDLSPDMWCVWLEDRTVPISYGFEDAEQASSFIDSLV